MSWWRGPTEVSNAWHWRVEHDNGTGSTQSEINVIMTKDYIGQTLDCRVNSSGKVKSVKNSDQLKKILISVIMTRTKHEIVNKTHIKFVGFLAPSVYTKEQLI